MTPASSNFVAHLFLFLSCNDRIKLSSPVNRGSENEWHRLLLQRKDNKKKCCSWRQRNLWDRGVFVLLHQKRQNSSVSFVSLCSMVQESRWHLTLSVSFDSFGPKVSCWNQNTSVHDETVPALCCGILIVLTQIRKSAWHQNFFVYVTGMSVPVAYNSQARSQLSTRPTFLCAAQAHLCPRIGIFKKNHFKLTYNSTKWYEKYVSLQLPFCQLSSFLLMPFWIPLVLIRQFTSVLRRKIESRLLCEKKKELRFWHFVPRSSQPWPQFTCLVTFNMSLCHITVCYLFEIAWLGEEAT